AGSPGLHQPSWGEMRVGLFGWGGPVEVGKHSNRAMRNADKRRHRKAGVTPGGTDSTIGPQVEQPAPQSRPNCATKSRRGSKKNLTGCNTTEGEGQTTGGDGLSRLHLLTEDLPG